ncbi:MAG: PD-(D/E)XK nuclease family protein [Campylobacterota bacterium]|nr:PD-(D/E)XK nuclease family protein [Campylobacterota bacterium]
MENQTIVLPSARAIRHEQLCLDDVSLFLPNYITMGEFISKLCIVENYKFIDDDSRVLLLLEASDFKEFSELQIERNFFTFTKNSSYIFKFFAELSAEKYEISLLSDVDIYGEFQEHISILIELYSRYENLCNERKYLDKIFIPKLYTFNELYAKSHKEISLKIDGHLTNFEFELLLKCSEYSALELIFLTSRFNVKMQKKFEDLGIALEVGYEYRISLNTKSILEKKETLKNKNISCESFSESLLQVAFVKAKIHEFIKKGYSAQNIAVVLPNESTAELLKSFDEKSNLNLAMGEPFSKSRLYTKLQATTKAIDQDSCENEARVDRVGDELYLKLYSIYYKESSETDFIGFLESIKEEFSNKQEIKIYEEEIHKFSKLLHFIKEMSVKSLLNLFMQRLSSRTMDDVRGGKVTVLGVLETRSVKFDGVIIVDFDDNNVPKRSDKDMFLNSQIRENANLPTMNDRENLQKHYYETLINSSKEVAISYVSSSQSSASRFLKQLAIKENNRYDELDYATLLFKEEKSERKEFEDREIEYSFKNIKLSSTRLKTYLTCKRKYYHKYVEHIKNHTIPKDMPQEYEIGNSVHLALKALYTKKNFYSDATLLIKDMNRELDNACGTSELDKYLIALQKKRLVKFAHNEVQRFSQGYRVAHTEELFEVEFHGMTLIGQIDRIDKNGTDVEVLDYKTGNYSLYNKNNFTEATDFQLEFYHLLASGLGSVRACGFYDLKESKIVAEAFLEEKLAILQSHVKDLLLVESIDTKKCEDAKECLYCEYRVMCDRE